MKFSGIILRIQLKSPKIAIIRAGATIAQAETGGLQAGSTPSLALREEVCRKLANAIRTSQESIELNVQDGVIVGSPSIMSLANAPSPESATELTAPVSTAPGRTSRSRNTSAKKSAATGKAKINKLKKKEK